jgi:hypothetical protein
MEQTTLFPVNDQLLQVIEEAPRLTMQEEKKIIAETKQLNIRYIRELCNSAAKQSISYIVQGTQYVISWLLNSIHEKQQKDHSLFREKIAAQLSSFLLFLQQQSGHWFNIDAPVPHHIWQPIHEKMLPRISAGKDFIFSGIEEEFIKAFQTIYHDTTTQPTPSFRQARYWQTLMDNIAIEKDHPQYDTTRCLFLLIRFNCNHPVFIRYVFTRYLLAVEVAENPHDHWQQALLHINRIIPEKESVLLINECDCKSSLLQLIETEISTVRFTEKAKNIMSVSTPFQYTLSVSQFAVWLRIQTESGMIAHQNTTELIRHFAEQTSTTRANGIAFKSLYNKYHEPERAAVQIMLEYNVRMHQMLKKMLY